MVAVLAQIDSLPGAHVQCAVGDRNLHTVAQQAGLYVSWHIVTTLVVMKVVWLVFLYRAVKPGFKVLPYGWVGVFVDG